MTPTFEIGKLAKKPQGATDEYTLDMPLDLDDPDIKPKSNLKGKVSIMKIDKEFNVNLQDIEVDLELECAKCLNAFTEKIKIPYAEKQYVIERKINEDREEIAYVDTQNQTINIDDFLREEIILHFPLIPVCSTHCKGINLKSNG